MFCYVIDVHLIDEYVSRLVKQKMAIAIMTIQSITYICWNMLCVYECVRNLWIYVNCGCIRAHSSSFTIYRSCCLFCSVVRNATINEIGVYMGLQIQHSTTINTRFLFIQRIIMVTFICFWRPLVPVWLLRLYNF